MKIQILLFLLFSFSLWGQDDALVISDEIQSSVAAELASAKAKSLAKEKAEAAATAVPAPEEDWAKAMYKTGKIKAPVEKAESFSESIKKTIAQFQGMSIIELENHIKITFKDSQYAPWFKKYPFFVTFIAEMLRSPEALPQMAKIADQKDKVVKISVGLLFTIILGMFMKRMVPKSAGFLLRCSHFFIRVFILNVLRIGIFVYFFKNEMGPTWILFQRHVLKNLFF